MLPVGAHRVNEPQAACLLLGIRLLYHDCAQHAVAQDCNGLSKLA